jgi:hypothetical protein
LGRRTRDDDDRKKEQRLQRGRERRLKRLEERLHREWWERELEDDPIPAEDEDNDSGPDSPDDDR